MESTPRIFQTRPGGRRPWPALGLLFALGCGDGSPPATQTAVRDSAGIRIVTSGAPRASEPWAVDLEPSVEIGTLEGDSTQALFRVFGATTLSDGRIVVAQSSPPMLRWYDAAGRFEVGTGRMGGGPGEFQGEYVSDLWALPGDSVATWEHAPRRMQVFDAAGRYARSVVLELPPDLRQGGYPQVVGRMREGFVSFLMQRGPPGVLGEVVRDSLDYLRHAPDGGYVGRIARLPGYTQFTMEVELPDGSKRETWGRPPFARIPVARAADTLFFYGSNERYEVAAFDPAGELRMLIRTSSSNLAVTDAMLAAYKAEAMARAPDDPSVRRSWEEILENAPYPDSLPAYRRFVADGGGMLWIEAYPVPGDDTATWAVFDAGGRWVSDVHLPADWRILDVQEDHVLVLVQDDFDVERVRRHELERG